jgi:hypothetical protein
VDLAERRILSVLKTRIAANIRQLEVKISEAGPPNIRPEPHIITDALKSLQKRGLVRKYKPPGEERRQETVFYTLEEFYPDKTIARVKQLLVPYRVHRAFADRDEYCARVLEDIVRRSFEASGRYKSLGKLPKTSPLDGVYQIGSEKIGMEAKNVREWVYPTSGEVWVMVRKCLSINAIPLLVARKTAYIAHTFFMELGIIHFDVFRQFFSKDVAAYLHEIQHTNLLGYKDVVAVDVSPMPHLVQYLKEQIPKQLASIRAKWDDQHDILTEFAITRKLGDTDMSDQDRWEHYQDLREALFPNESKKEGDDRLDW